MLWLAMFTFNIICDPLEQFSVEVFQSYNYLLYFFGGGINVLFYTSIGKIICFIIFVLCFFIYSDESVIGVNKKDWISSFFFLLVVDVIKGALAVKRYSSLLLFYSVFLFILVSNLVGVMPFGFTITSHLILTIFFSLSLFIGHNIVGVFWNEEKYFCLFLPNNIPFIIIPLLVVIEFISYYSRIFSLSIRLFANMMSGHILLKILIGFIFIQGSSSLLNWTWIWLPALIVLGVIIFEIAVAGLQAYVFTTLSIIYLNNAINIH